MFSNFTMRLRNIIKNPMRVILFLSELRAFNWLPDKQYLYLYYYARMGKRLNLDKPLTFNEKLQWLKLYDRPSEYTTYVDKYAVREYIKNMVGEQYLIPLIGVYDSFDEIKFDELPNKFVLKCTHDSGGLIICKDKNILNIKKTKTIINKYLNKNYYWSKREWPYKKVIPKIVCEQYMEDDNNVELKDYKLFCFSGEPKIIQVDYNRFSEHKRNLYDLKWNYIQASIKYPTDPNIMIEKPKDLEKMLKLARILSRDYPHIRIDFYYIKDQIYFGEMTLYHGSGYEHFDPASLGVEMGNWIQLPYKGNLLNKKKSMDKHIEFKPNPLEK